MILQYLDDRVEEGQQPGIHFIDCFGSAQGPFTVTFSFALDLGDPEQLIHFVDPSADGAACPTVEGDLLESADTQLADNNVGV